MRSIVIFSLALMVSLNTFAADKDLSKSIAKSLTNQNKTQQNSQNSSIYYGGKDISHPLVAANKPATKNHHPIVIA